MIRSENSNINLISISELLKIFDLNLELSEEVLNIEVADCFKFAKLSKDDNQYNFRFNDYCLIITPFESKQKVVVSEEQSYRSSPLKMFYNNEGVLYKIT